MLKFHNFVYKKLFLKWKVYFVIYILFQNYLKFQTLIPFSFNKLFTWKTKVLH